MFIRLVLFFMLFAVQSVGALELEIPNKGRFDVEVADTAEKKEIGLMFITDLPEDKGMIFDFKEEESQYVRMWMKNTYVSLDMIFLDCDFKVVDYYENAVPLSLVNIGSYKKFCFVLEVLGGTVKRKSIQIGDKFSVIQ